MALTNQIVPLHFRTKIASLVLITIAAFLYFSLPTQRVHSSNPPSVVVNKYQNSGTTLDIVELLVIQNNLDMRGMILKDFSANMVNDGGGKYQFSTDAVWSSVRSGTLIVLRNNNTAADTSVGGADYNLDIGLQNTTYFSNLGGTFDIATTDMLMIKDAGSGLAGVTGSIHVLAGGTAGAQFTAAAIFKLIASGTSGSGQFVFANNSTQSLNDFNGTDATGAATGLTFGSGNNANNTAYINSLRAGGGGITISINNVSQAETNAGTTTFAFTVTLSAPAPAAGVTFDIATADGVTNPANAGSDYVGQTLLAQTITSGNTTYPFNVTVNGDTTPEPSETFFVNVTNVVNATPASIQGLGTIQNDDFSLTPIHDIQGNGDTSPFDNTAVSTNGVVTLLKSNGFFLQEPDATIDADPNTSEGIFVFTSTAPTVALGDNVSVSGTVDEFGTGGTNTEITGVSGVITNSTGNSLPAAITLTVTDLSPTALPAQPQLEKYEDMRVTASLKTVSPNDNFFDVDTVLSSVARPIREIGMEISATIPPDPTSGLPDVNIPRWDENPERLSVDTNGRAGSTGMALTSNVSLGTVAGVLDFAFAEYHLIPDVDPTPSANMTFVPVPVPLASEFTVACFNIENFANNATQRQKAARAIRQVMLYPDIIGHEEIASLAALQALRDQVNNDAVGAGDPNPLYQAYLTGTGAQNVGFLVKTARVSVISVTEEPVGTYINPLTGLPEPLHDRPPLTLRATVDPTGPNPIPVIVVVNHPRSFIDVDADPSPPGDGARVRAKRKAQAESIAALLDNLQDNNPNNSIMTVGDFNAFQFNDGYTDPIATIKGTPTADDQIVVDQSPDSVSPDFFNLTDRLPVGERYSFVFEGTAQALDHIIINRNANARFTRYAIARFDADFPGIPAAAFVNDPSRPEGCSDHDAPVAYFNLTTAPSAADGTVIGRITDPQGVPIAGSVVQLSGSQTRKTITDAGGNYRFTNVETNGFYTVTPSRANYAFSPANRSFSLVGNQTEAAFTASSLGDNANPIDTAEFFVRQEYLDLLGREPDELGFNYWSEQINQCANDQRCVADRRRDVAVAFFTEDEFQRTGSFIQGLYKGALGRSPAFSEYSADRQQVVGGANLETQKQSFADSFVQRAEFIERYQGTMSAESFVEALIQNVQSASAIDLSNQRANLIARYQAGTNLNQSRSLVVREITESSAFRNAEYNSSFVLSEYFAYLRRDADPRGYAFWKDVLDHGDPGNYRGMVCGFINSVEYQRRFSAVVTRSDAECTR